MQFKALAAVAGKLSHPALRVQKHSPAILFGVGVVGVVGTVVLACRSTLKLEEVLENRQEELQKVNEVQAMAREDYSDLDAKRDKTIVYTKLVMDIAKLYALPIVIGAASIGALTGAHFILNKRNVALSAAYAAIDKGFKEYRQRVVDEFGPDKDKELRYATKEHTIVEEGENGPETKTVKRVGLDKEGHSIYARCFDETNPKWKREMSYNQVYIQCQQNYANDRLRAKGHLFLNDVYKMLGFEDTKEGQIVGWVWNGKGDNFVDFGVFEGDEFSAIQFVEGEEPSVWLDFNVDGVVWDQI
jgi:hypothetical protein